MKFDLVTPERRIAAFSAAYISAPGSEGDFGVMPGHAPFLSSLRPGALVVRTDSGEQKVFCVSHGFVDVVPEGVTVLAEEAVLKDDIVLEKAQVRVKDAEKRVDEAERDSANTVALVLALKELDKARAQLLVAEMK
jgi:F-type H+-transporting ATPase subunit epsilon